MSRGYDFPLASAWRIPGQLYFTYGLYIAPKTTGSRGSSVSIVSDYGLDDRAIEVRSPAEAKGFFLLLCPDRI
jgi:hypothetical protein